MRKTTEIILSFVDFYSIERLCGASPVVRRVLCGIFDIDGEQQTLLGGLLAQRDSNGGQSQNEWIDSVVRPAFRQVDLQFYAEFWENRLLEESNVGRLDSLCDHPCRQVRHWYADSWRAAENLLVQERVEAARLYLLDSEAPFDASDASVLLRFIINDENAWRRWARVRMAYAIYDAYQKKTKVWKNTLVEHGDQVMHVEKELAFVFIKTRKGGSKNKFARVETVVVPFPILVLTGIHRLDLLEVVSSAQPLGKPFHAKLDDFEVYMPEYEKSLRTRDTQSLIHTYRVQRVTNATAPSYVLIRGPEMVAVFACTTNSFAVAGIVASRLRERELKLADSKKMFVQPLETEIVLWLAVHILDSENMYNYFDLIHIPLQRFVPLVYEGRRIWASYSVVDFHTDALLLPLGFIGKSLLGLVESSLVYFNAPQNNYPISREESEIAGDFQFKRVADVENLYELVDDNGIERYFVASGAIWKAGNLIADFLYSHGDDFARTLHVSVSVSSDGLSETKVAVYDSQSRLFDSLNRIFIVSRTAQLEEMGGEVPNLDVWDLEENIVLVAENTQLGDFRPKDAVRNFAHIPRLKMAVQESGLPILSTITSNCKYV